MRGTARAILQDTSFSNATHCCCLLPPPRECVRLHRTGTGAERAARVERPSAELLHCSCAHAAPATVLWSCGWPGRGSRGCACSPRKASSARPPSCRRPWMVLFATVWDGQRPPLPVTRPARSRRRRRPPAPPQPVWGRMAVMELTLACFRAPAPGCSRRHTGGRWAQDRTTDSGRCSRGACRIGICSPKGMAAAWEEQSRSTCGVCLPGAIRVSESHAHMG